MSHVTIRVEHLSKQYKIGQRERYKALRDTLTDTMYAPFRAIASMLNGRWPAVGAQRSNNYVWALKDVSFEVKRGEVIGIIGRNGAGKSTLLKILSRITEPTEGRAEIHGRVGSLLEVGTGFHPELTGRENIYLNGAILGMKRSEIERKFDEIVAFAEVERFIETPVKHYSSGMYMRLAFAVAAHLEPEILVVDEVLAVGDVAFQKKCLGKMEEKSSEGTTVVLVSHNMAAIQQLCSSCFWLDAGSLKQRGRSDQVVEAYLAATHSRNINPLVSFAEDLSKASQVRSMRTLNEAGIPTTEFTCDNTVIVEVLYQVHRPVRGLYGCFQVTRQDGLVMMVAYSHDIVPNPLDYLSLGMYTFRISIPPRSLGHGNYTMQFGTAAGRVGTSIIEDVGTTCSFSLSDFKTLSGNGRIGCFSTVLDWDVQRNSASPEILAVSKARQS